MLRYLRISLISLMLLFAPHFTAGANAPEWEHIETTRTDPSDDERVEVMIRDSYIYLSASRPVTVKICTILGQTVSQAKLPAGVSRIKLSQRGVYILKAGATTRRVNI